MQAFSPFGAPKKVPAGRPAPTSPSQQQAVLGRRFLVYKRSILKGRYPRILDVSATGIKSCDPLNGATITNEWSWDQVLGCEPEVDGVTLSCQGKGGIFGAAGPEKHYLEGNTALIIGAFLSESSSRFPGRDQTPRFEVAKLAQSRRQQRRVYIVLGVEAVQVFSADTNLVESEYFYSAMTRFGLCTDGVYVETYHERAHVFQCSSPKEVLEQFMKKAAILRLSLSRRDYAGKDVSEMFSLLGGGPARMACQSAREPCWYSTTCEKVENSSAYARRRTLKVFFSPPVIQETEDVLDEGQVRIVSVRFIHALEAIVCPSDQPTIIVLNFKDRTSRQYRTSNRDMLASVLLDVGWLESYAIPHYSSSSSTKLRLVTEPLPELTLIMFQNLLTTIRLLNSQQSDSAAIVRAFAEFNANAITDGVSPTSPTPNDKQELQTIAIAFANELLERPKVPIRAVNEVMQTLRRAVRFSTLVVNKNELIRLGNACLKKGDDFVVKSWLQVLMVLCSTQHQESSVAYAHRQSFIGNASGLAKLFSDCLSPGAPAAAIPRGTLTQTALVTFVLEPLLVTERDTTPPEVYDALIRMLLINPRNTLKLLGLSGSLPGYSQQIALVFARLFEDEQVQGVIDDVTRRDEPNVLLADLRKQLENEAMMSGYFLDAFRNAVFGESRVKRATSRLSVALFCSSSKDILVRLVPPGLIHALDVPSLDNTAMNALLEEDKMEDYGFRDRFSRAEKVQRCGSAPRKKRDMGSNFPVFFHMIQHDHSLPDLIWNENTRNDLKLALDKELSDFTFGDNVAWNYSEFVVEYVSLSGEMLLGDCYVRLLLDEDELSAHKLVKQIREPLHFFHSLFHYLLRSSTTKQRVECLRALKLVQIVHGHVFSQSVPNGMQEIVTLVEMLTQTISRVEFDYAFLLLRAMCEDHANVKLLLRTTAGPVALRLSLFALSRIHSKRSDTDSPKEWFFKRVDDQESQRHGPLHLSEIKMGIISGEIILDKSRFWAAGMQKEWHTVLEIPQLKYELSMIESSSLDVEILALSALELLTKFAQATPPIDGEGRWIRPVPKALRILAERDNICILANALTATTYPRVIDSSANLLAILGSTPDLVRKLYLSGAFYFALSYQGSNFEGISRFLFATHLEQHFSEEALNSNTSIKRRSILGELLPESMLYVLQDSADKFRLAFIGADTDNPELIWTGEMRREMISAIQSHLQGFPARLKENSYARFDFVPIPPLTYERLEKETFCARFYLENLCNLDRFPSWPITDPVALFKAAMDTWRREGEKFSVDAHTTSREDALQCLELSGDATLEDIKKAFRKLARQFHPDRNPNGRDRFEQVQLAYEQLVAPRAEYLFRREMDPVTLQCVLKCQIIVIERFPDVIGDFRYPGFELLLDLLDELKVTVASLDDNQGRLLSSACRLLYRVCWASHHNGEELVKQVSRISQYACEFRQLPDCLASVLRVVAGLSVLSGDARDGFAKEKALLELMQSLPRIRETALRQPDSVMAVFRTAKSDLGISSFLTSPEFLKLVPRWMLIYDPTFQPASTLDDPFFMEDLAGQAQSGVKNALAKSALEIVAKHPSFFADVFPAPLLCDLVASVPLSMDTFLTKFIQGSIESLTLLWTPGCLADLGVFLGSKDIKCAYPSYDSELIVGQAGKIKKFFVRMFVEQKSPSEPEFPSAVVEYCTAACDPTFKEAPERISMAANALKTLVASTDSNTESEIKMALSSDALTAYLVSPVFQDIVPLFIERFPKDAMRSVIQVLEDETDTRIAHGLKLTSRFWEAAARTAPGVDFMLDNPDVVFELLARSVLLDDGRALAALSQSAWDIASKDRLMLLLNSWLPRGLCEIVTNPDQFGRTLAQSSVETCRLIWGTGERKELEAFLGSGYQPDCRCVYKELAKETELGGVYLRVFLKDPNQELEHPELFLEKCMEAFIAECARRHFACEASQSSGGECGDGASNQIMVASQTDDSVLTPLSSAIVALMVVRPALCAHVSVWGNARALSSIVYTSHAFGHEVAGALRIIRAASGDGRCLRAFGDCAADGNPESNLAEALITVVERAPDTDVSSLAMEIMRTTLEASDIEAARSIALLLTDNNFTLAVRLVKIVDGSEKMKHRVHLIEALRRLESRFGSALLTERLEAGSSTWAKLKLQRHDLFISDRDERTGHVFLIKGPAEASRSADAQHLLTNRADDARSEASARASLEDFDDDEPPL